MTYKFITKKVEIILRWLAYSSAIMTLIFAYRIYDQYNVTTSIKNKETEIVLDLLNNINSKTVYFESWSGFELDTSRKIQYDRLIFETTLTSVVNVLDKEVLDKEILMDIRFNNYLTELKEKYLNAPIPLNLKTALNNCISQSQAYFPNTTLNNITHINMIGTNYPLVLPEMFISFTDGNKEKFICLPTKQYFDNWMKLHITLLVWLEVNSNIEPYNYYKKEPDVLRHIFDERRTTTRAHS